MEKRWRSRFRNSGFNLLFLLAFCFYALILKNVHLYLSINSYLNIIANDIKWLYIIIWLQKPSAGPEHIHVKNSFKMHRFKFYMYFRARTFQTYRFIQIVLSFLCRFMFYFTNKLERQKPDFSVLKPKKLESFILKEFYRFIG